MRKETHHREPACKSSNVIYDKNRRRYIMGIKIVNTGRTPVLTIEVPTR